MALPVALQDVVDVMDTISEEMTALINRKTGELISVSEEEFSLAEGDDSEDDAGESAPEWRREFAELAKTALESDDYIPLPDRFEIHEYAIMERFCHSVAEQRVRDALLLAIRGRGAFRAFKDRIADYGVREDWFAFKTRAMKNIAANFLEEQGIAFIDE